MVTHIVIPKESLWKFKVNPDTPISESLGWVLSNFISMDLDTKHKVLKIDNAVEEVMNYYIINNKIISFNTFIRVLNYSEEFFDFIVIVKYGVIVKGVILPNEIVIRFSDIWEG